MHLITLFRVMNPHQRCFQAKVKYRNEPKQVMPKSEDLCRSLEINAIRTFDTEFPTIFNKSCRDSAFNSLRMQRRMVDSGTWGYLKQPQPLGKLHGFIML